ncbi:MAG TPA: RDD family protein [Conexibacter sp.]|nr:RDD family protein [Conexibacter sp.]
MPTEQLSDWWPRARAFLLDQLILAGVTIVGALTATAVMGDPSRRTIELVVYAIAIPIGLLYAPLLMARRGERNGQTLGKQIVGIRVVRTDGAPVGFWLGVLRTVVAQQLLAGITFYAYAVVDYLWPLRDPQNQALHDKIAKTWVVQVAAPDTGRASDTRQTAASAFGPVEPDEVPVQGWLPPRAPGE